MNNLAQAFSSAQARITASSKRPKNTDLLALYIHYKQATVGDATGERPRMSDFVARAKFDAWTELKGLSQEEAMQKYIELVDRILAEP